MEKDIIESFFKALQNRDFKKMESCYDRNIQYFDPLYGFLKKNEVMYMWKLFYLPLQEFNMSFENMKDEGEGYYSIQYEFSFFNQHVNRQLTRKIKSHIRIVNGLIAEQSNAFRIHEWCKQENGIIGVLIGWNKYYQNKIKLRARRLLFNSIDTNKFE